uniref:Uncharacterized protein n=1 Tax=Anopheles minimus TaxID=112268 RepID=A0A182VVN4_9DIPT
MDDNCYERSAHTSDGFTHGYYWKTGKVEIHTEKLLPQGFEVNMNHHQQLGGGYDGDNSTARGHQDYWSRPHDYHGGAGATGSGSGTTGRGGVAPTGPVTGMNAYSPKSKLGSLFDGHGTDASLGGSGGSGIGRDLGYGYDDDHFRPGGSAYLPADPAHSSLPNGVGGARTGRKLPNPTRNGKRQLPQPKGGGVFGSAGDFRSKAPAVRKLPIPQRNPKTINPTGPQPPLIDNFNIDLSVKLQHLKIAPDSRCMDDNCYERSAHTSDGFTHGYYWKTGKVEIHTEKLLPQGFEVNMNHHQQLGGGYDGDNSTARGHQDYWSRPHDYHGGAGATGSGSGTTGRGGVAPTGPVTGMNAYSPKSKLGSLFDGHGTDASLGGSGGSGIGRDLGYGYDDDHFRPGGSAYLPADPAHSSLPNGVGGARTGRKLPNPTRNGKRQLPQPKGGGVFGSAGDFRSKAPAVRKLPIPQRNPKTINPTGPQPPLIDNFNIDLSVKARKSISGPIDDDSLKRLNSNIFGNSINYFCDLSQNKENFITTSSFYVNDDDTDDYCYSDFFMTSSITLSSRKIKKLPKIQNIANHPRSSQSMSFIAADVNAAYRNFSLVAEAPYNDGYAPADEYADGRGLPAPPVASQSPGYCNHNPIYSEQLDSSNSTDVGALMLNGGLGMKPPAGSSGAPKKQLPSIQPPVHESLGYPYKQQHYPTGASRDEPAGHGMLPNGHKEYAPRPTLMNDRVTALKSRSRSSTPVSSSGGSSSRSDYSGGVSTRQQQQQQQQQQSSFDQGYDAMSHVPVTSSSSTPKLLPSKPASKNQGSYLAGSPDKKPPLRRSPDRTLDGMYYHDESVDPYLLSPEQSTMPKESKEPVYEPHRTSNYDQLDDAVSGTGPELYDDDRYGDEDRLPGEPPTAKKLPKVSHQSDGLTLKKQLHFFDEREECFDEELEELEQANAAKQGGNVTAGSGVGGAGLLVGASAGTNALLEHGYDAKADKLEQLTGAIPGSQGAGGVGVPGTGGTGLGPGVPSATTDATGVNDLSKDITQQQQQGKRENFNARDKWLWAYDQIINVSTSCYILHGDRVD